jgi:hypothetical protein
VVTINLPKITDINAAIRKEAFEIQLPQHLPPSYNYTLGTELK